MQGHKISEAARNLDINPNVLRQWSDQFKKDSDKAFSDKGQMKSSTKMKASNFINSQLFVFIICLCVFLLAAAFGWEKLQYGFNFLDEGWHMVEGWRLASGDRLFTFTDISGDALLLYKVFNALFFKIYPDITLLGFRKLQFILTLISLLIFSYALYRIDNQYWYQPLIFSCFIFTGFDPIGIISNMNYYTYPHFFLILYISYLMLGLYQKTRKIKRVLFIASGLSLSCISFSLLHTSVILVAPFLLFLFSRVLKFKSLSFNFSDLCYVVIPFLIPWIFFIALYNRGFIQSVIYSINLKLSMPGYSSHSFFNSTLNASLHIITAFIILLLCVTGLKKMRPMIAIVWLAIMSLVMFFIIDTSFFGLIPPFFYPVEWCYRPMWFSALFISFLILFWLIILKRYFTLNHYSKNEEWSVVLLIPCTILFVDMSIFSANGALLVLLCSIPIAAGIANFLVYQTNIRTESYAMKGLFLLIFFLPFYYSTVWSDWNFSFFDVSPVHEDCTIHNGFGKGIKTNCVYRDLYYWIVLKTDIYTTKNDYIISYIDAPMVYMIAKRRPSIDDSWVNLSLKSTAFSCEENIEMMKRLGRYPKMAFIFDSAPGIIPLSFKNNYYMWFQTTAPASNNPISAYIYENMSLMDQFTFSNRGTVKCFVDKKLN